MNNLMDKHFYKVISLFIKAILLFISFYYIFQKLTTADAFNSFRNIVFSVSTTLYLLLALLLMLVNWGLEAKKWQLLISSYEQLSFFQSLQAVMAGVTLSIFTPNRIGEFTGRVFFLKKADKFIASGKSIIGSFFQLIITILAGFVAIFVYIRYDYNSTVPLYSLFNQQKSIVWMITVLSILILLIGIWRLSFLSKFRHDLKKMMEIKKAEWVQLFLLSLNRYLIFTLQHYLLILAMGAEVSIMEAFILIPVTFFITSIIPTFALTEIVVRSAVAVYVFAALDSVQPASIASASLLLWMINLAIPALIGSIFIGKLQFFKAH